MRLLLLAAVLLFHPFIASTNDGVEFAKGSLTTLQFVYSRTAPDPGQNRSTSTTLNLHSKSAGEIISTAQLDGKWFCLGYYEPAHIYLIGGIFQKGASLPMASIRYLSEDGKRIEPSAFDNSGYQALSAVASPSGRYIVFIGGRLTTDGLYLLDLKRDKIRKLGKPPLPPPNANLSGICRDEPFEWGGCWADGYLEMDSGIIRFTSEKEVEVRYGKDLPSARAKKRRINRFRLNS